MASRTGPRQMRTPVVRGAWCVVRKHQRGRGAFLGGVRRPNSVTDDHSVRYSVTQSRYSFVYERISSQAIANDQI